MKNLFIQQCDCKFINNLLMTNLSNININSCVINNNLYQLYYQKQFSQIIFTSSLFTAEINQFIHEHSNDVEIFLYHNIVGDNTQQAIHSLPRNIKHLVSYKHKLDNCITVPNLINTELFYNNNEINKQDNIICFLDDIDTLPDSMGRYFYPNSMEKIRLFNNEKIHHNQNLGLLSEKEKAEILQKNKYYLALSDLYIVEAKCCGCVVIDVDEIKVKKSRKYANISTSVPSYKDFIESIL